MSVAMKQPTLKLIVRNVAGMKRGHIVQFCWGVWFDTDLCTFFMNQEDTIVVDRPGRIPPATRWFWQLFKIEIGAPIFRLSCPGIPRRSIEFHHRWSSRRGSHVLAVGRRCNEWQELPVTLENFDAVCQQLEREGIHVPPEWLASPARRNSEAA